MLTPANGICNDQYLLVTGTIWPLGFKRLCGINPDQHFYVHLNDAGNFEHIDFAVTTVHSNRPYKFGESMIVHLFFPNNSWHGFTDSQNEIDLLLFSKGIVKVKDPKKTNTP